MASTIPKIKLNNGIEMPVLGLGTWKSKPGEVEQAIKDAINIGYRHIDGAYCYENEKEVGAAINEKIKDGTVKRSDLFVTSKLWNTFHNPAVVEKACRKTLSDLNLDYLDLYLIHWPMAYAEADVLFPREANGDISLSDFDYVDTWSAMEKLVEKGLVKSIGVSNFNSEQIARILEKCKIKPVTNQVECHPYLAQIELGEWLNNKGITITSYSPLGSPDRTEKAADEKVVLKDPIVAELAAKYGKSPAQILLRYHIDRGFIVIPKSVNPERLKQNISIFDFSLKLEDMKKLNGLNCNGRLLPMIGIGDISKYYPFNIKF